ncbi:hypothetical protein N9K78_02470 [Aquiluna sp.]|nr:hypothetical protein [Aquiluna sp.]
MFATAISNVREFLGSWKNLLAIGTLPLLGGWIFSRVWMVNPAILGDEYLYSLNARKAGPWDPPLAGDFSNYLFNFVYQGTNLCGDAFYTCGKVFNIVFFLGFIFTLFVVALRFMPFWFAYFFMISAGLSPLSVYTSMFLPESMYFFFVGFILLSVLRAMESFSWVNWGLVGISVGVASLVKPHAWLTAIAIGITLLVVGLGSPALRLRPVIVSGLAAIGGALAGRAIVGLAVGGPKALNFFGVYLGNSTLEQIAAGTSVDSSEQSVVGTSGMDGVIGLFGVQLEAHVLAVVAGMGIAVIGVTVAIFEIFRSRRLEPVSAFGLFAFIWLATLVIEIVAFTGWITGQGDDHTSRILLRYYDYLFVIVPLAGLSVANSEVMRKVNAFVRWGLVLLVGFALTPAFTGFFATLEIQIADAPSLAGVVVNQQVFNALAVMSFGALLVFAAFPSFTKWALIALMPLSMVATGWQTQDQYQNFRGTLSVGDLAGQYLRANFTESELDQITIITYSRFDGTNAGIWMDVDDIRYEIAPPGTEIPAELFEPDRQIFLFLGEYELLGDSTEIYSGDGFRLLDARN